jgi:hypothetical protein
LVDGTVVSDAGGTAEYWAQYGTTKAYGSETTHQSLVLQQNSPLPVGVQISGLQRSTVYHYRLCAQDGSQRGGPGCGVDRTLETQSIACGETVTTSVRLTDDLFCLDGPSDTPGLTVGAPGIVIDLNGFEIRGQVFVGPGAGTAIDNSGGFDGVTIKDGTLSDFGDGIHLEDASANRILGVRSFGPSDGIEVQGGSDNEIRHSDASGRDNGLVASNTTGLIVADGTTSGTFGQGMVLGGLIGSRIVRNDVGGITVAGNGNVIKENIARGGIGGNIVVASGADNKLLENEVFNNAFPSQPGTFDSEGDGIFVGALTAGTIVRGNHTHDNDGDGIEVQGVETRITDNTADANGDFGIDGVSGVTDGGGNMASGNGNPLQCRNVFCL